MWVMSPDGKNLVDVAHFHVVRNIGGKDGKKYVVQGFHAGSQAVYNFAMYPDEESAMEELAKVFGAIEAGVPVYRFPK